MGTRARATLIQTRLPRLLFQSLLSFTTQTVSICLILQAWQSAEYWLPDYTFDDMPPKKATVMLDSSDEDELATASNWQIRSQPTTSSSRPEIRLPDPPTSAQFDDDDSAKVVDRILNEVPAERGDVTRYEIEYDDGHPDFVTHAELVALNGGQDAIDAFDKTNQDDASDFDAESSPEPVQSVRTRASRRPGRPRKSEQPVSISSDEELIEASDDSDSPPRRPIRQTRLKQKPRLASPDDTTRSRRGGRKSDDNSVRRSSRQVAQVSSYKVRMASPPSSDDDSDLFESDLVPKAKRRRLDDGERDGLRTSARTTRNRTNMQEASMADTYRSDSDRPRPAPKPATTKEIFKPVPLNDTFARRHVQQCDSCERPAGPNGPLIYCQGCTLSYHKQCLGHRTNRDHLVTKIADDDFVLQCRRCINLHRKKDIMAPDLSICQTCRDPSPACHAFRVRKTPAQEAKDREENDGVDPITPVSEKLVNNSDNVLWRCTECARAFHFHHLPPKSSAMDVVGDDETVANERYREYASDWLCRQCMEKPAKVSELIAWRPVDPEEFSPDIDTTEVPEDEKEYLIKWDKRSYFQAQWAPGAWVHGVTGHTTRKAFSKRNNGHNVAILTTEEAIPEDNLRIDIVLEVKFTSFVETRAEEIDKARIREVDVALIKYKGLGYEDAVWEKVPTPDDGDRWSDFVKAYDDWVTGRYVKMPRGSILKARVEKARSTDFNELEKKEQPKGLSGGELMKYQLEGVNWLLYRWYQKQNGILADEMGLGKTIQIIGLIAALAEDYNCVPFLLVVPNSTCPNWRREIKTWAPSLRVVTYYGTAQSRRLAYEHELFPEGSKSLKCHVVVTSYEAAGDDSCRKFFRSVPWQGLIVDEGQRLKSDKTNLYGALSSLKIPFSILLTGTPLQNNARELFNLLQFLDPSFDAAALDLEYEELTQENIPRLHEMIRPFFLRRTKAQVLTFLPSLAQVILPLSMSIVQRKLYRNILSKKPELIRSIFNNDGNAKTDKSGLNNILMQLRKALAHPFAYSQEIEERNVSNQVSHRNLVDASAKLQLLELLLPKLKAKGHRVLIFSQFLSMLDIVEDFMDGMEFRYQRLDGTVNSLTKQKRIDQFNAPDSELFAFLLSTRAGGVGINLATADTVIILDPDFNPHQDIQAVSRAHRIGQTKKVLCFQLMTSASVEERIMQIGKSKMALDHVLIERMGDDEENTVDVESILKHGAAAILEGDDELSRHVYDDASIEKLLDRSQIEDTRSGEDMTAESQFSFARVWANESSTMVDGLKVNETEERAPDATVWDKILQERERVAAEEAARRHEALGRGRRTKQVSPPFQIEIADMTTDKF